MRPAGDPGSASLPLANFVDLHPAPPECVDAAPTAGDVEQLDPADAGGSAGSTMRCSPIGSSPSIVRRNSSGAPVDQACGLHDVGYCTGYFVSDRRIAAERLGEAAVEVDGRVEDPGRDAARLRP